MILCEESSFNHHLFSFHETVLLIILIINGYVVLTIHRTEKLLSSTWTGYNLCVHSLL